MSLSCSCKDMHFNYIRQIVRLLIFFTAAIHLFPISFCNFGTQNECQRTAHAGGKYIHSHRLEIVLRISGMRKAKPGPVDRKSRGGWRKPHGEDHLPGCVAFAESLRHSDKNPIHRQHRQSHFRGMAVTLSGGKPTESWMNSEKCGKSTECWMYSGRQALKKHPSSWTPATVIVHMTGNGVRVSGKCE